jgi:ubiquinone/menaquinone biosynthesis C-methylase UbiE
MKLNLGCGYKKEEGYVNIDDDPLVNPDYAINLDDVNIKLPFDDNTVEEVKAHHILEHIGDGYLPLMKELYRVCKHGAIVDIAVPHHFHEVYYGDPTHKRPITVSSMYLMGKKYIDYHISVHSSSSGIAYKYGIDFEVIWFDFEYDEFYREMVENMKQKQQAGQMSKEEEFMFTRLMREAINVAQNTLIKLVAIKEYE